MPKLRTVEGVGEVSACFGLMKQLRPHLNSPEDFIARWRRQQAENYHLLAVWEQEAPVALAGYRYQENLLHGPHLYVDDLVTGKNVRGIGYGSLILERLKAEAEARALSTLVLDAALSNVLGHRFYFRNGFLARGLHFWAEINKHPQGE